MGCGVTEQVHMATKQLLMGPNTLGYQQTASCHGLPDERPPPLARLLTTFVGVLNMAAAACTKAGCVGRLVAPPCTTRFAVI